MSLARRRILDAFDALSAVACGRTTLGATRETAQCDHCGGSGVHSPDCAVAAALRALAAIVPTYARRDAWLLRGER